MPVAGVITGVATTPNAKRDVCHLGHRPARSCDRQRVASCGDAPVTKLIVVDPEVFTVVGLNVAVAPEGRPLTKADGSRESCLGRYGDRIGRTSTRLTVCVPGEADSEKAGITVIVHRRTGVGDAGTVRHRQRSHICACR